VPDNYSLRKEDTARETQNYANNFKRQEAE
jgi:hypothetical protein